VKTQNTTQRSISFIREPLLIGSLPSYNNDRLGFYQRVVRECGNLGGFHLGPLPIVLVSGADEVQHILIDQHEAFRLCSQVQDAFWPLTGKGLLTSEGELHRQQRKLMAPSFQPRHIMKHADTIVMAGEQVQQSWQDGTIIDIGQTMTHVTMRIIGKVLFDANLSDADELGRSLATVLEWINKALFLPLPRLFWVVAPRSTKRALATLKKSIQSRIDERHVTHSMHQDLLALLLGAEDEEGKGMNDRQALDESLTLFFAGHETTATALTWAWYLLATYPNVYRRLQEEVDNVLQGRTPTYNDLPHLPYSLQVFKESLRLYPSIHAIIRFAGKHDRIGAYSIPRGSTILISPYAVHRRSEYYPEPEKFDPERFAPENEKLRPRYAYVPFGAGPRICIGNHFATMEGHLMLATLAQRVTFGLVTNHIDPDPKITIRSKQKIQMVVQRRN
jgi:cytochrome P450